MASPVVLPRQGQSVESCIITQWHKQEGDTVAVGDVLFTYETDKATFEEQAKEAGTLLKVFFAEDDDVPVLTTVAVIGQPGEDVSALHRKAKLLRRSLHRKPPRPYKRLLRFRQRLLNNLRRGYHLVRVPQRSA